MSEQFPQSPEPTEAELDRAIQEILDNLPTELADRWASETEDLPSAECLVELQRRYENRLHALYEKNGGERTIHALDMASARAQAAIAERAREEGVMIGRGKNAEVFEDPDHTNRCYKFIRDSKELITFNSVEREAEILSILDEFEIEGVRTPALHWVVDFGTTKIICMERLTACSIEDVLEGRAHLPEQFDSGAFFEALRSYITNLHRTHQLYHRDLHEGNIMIDFFDPDHPTPRVIDFGRSKRSALEEEAYQVTDPRGIGTVTLVSDEEHIRGVERKLNLFLARKN